MPSHKLHRDWRAKLKSAVPFGLGQTKPKHFRDMAAVAWQNRDNLGYAWKVLSRGVCDGCALGVAGFHDWTIEGIHLCMTRLNLLRLNTMPGMEAERLGNIAELQSLSDWQLRELGRLAYPMIREKSAPGFRRISWDEALHRIATRMRGCDPKRLAFYLTSRGVTNEVYYMAQKIARFLGTNNIDNAARLCHSPSTAAMKHGLGVAATTCSYRDWFGTDLVIFFGANPANDQPVSMKYLDAAKKLGTKVILVNPYREPGMERYWVPSSFRSATLGTDIADYWFPVSTGGDIAFLYGVLKVLLSSGWEDQKFVGDHTTGFRELEAQVSNFTFDELEAQSGLDRASMREFAELIRDAKTAVLVWSMGITQHAFGGDAVQMILNLGLTKGFVGRDKCGLMPIRGHSSVQGGAEMGAYSTAFPGGNPINSESAAALSKAYGFVVPDWRGLTAPEMVEACARGDLDLLYCLGGNFLYTLPEPHYVRQALANTPVRVHQDIIVTEQMLIPAKEEVILLPAKTRYEQDDGGTETSTERRIMFSPEIPRRMGEARAEWKILRELAALVYPERAHLLGCETGWKMREEIPRIVPLYEGVQNLRKIGDSLQYGGPHLCADWKFPTHDGKAHFRVVPLPPEGPEIRNPKSEIRNKFESEEIPKTEKRRGNLLAASQQPRPLQGGTLPDEPGQVSDSVPRRLFIVSTRRGKQFNSLIYAEIDPINGAPRDAVLMNQTDAAELHLAQNDRIALTNEIGRFEGRVFLAPIARGNLQIHWPEGNVLIRRGVTDPAGGVPDYNARAKVERLN